LVVPQAASTGAPIASPVAATPARPRKRRRDSAPDTALSLHPAAGLIAGGFVPACCSRSF
jgi:hypothetical protein